uniref:Uncharacterized protein n=1 Tax=Rhizophora mucronata TaxID=61149 RepID=A0A2P2NI52_RHIMU
MNGRLLHPLPFFKVWFHSVLTSIGLLQLTFFKPLFIFLDIICLLPLSG